MNVRLVWILSLLMIGLGCAAEIVAWKVPLNRFAWGGLETEGVARLKSAPEESPFFTDGDELWDLKGIAIENSEGVKVAPEWVVWNAGTGRLVAKGDWAKITAIHEMLRIDQLASHCRLKLSLVPVTDEALVPSRDSKPVAEISVVSRSGQIAKASWSGGGYDVSVDTEVTIGDGHGLVDLRIVWNSDSADQPGFQVNTALTLLSGESVWLARDFDGNQGFDLMAFAEVESIDGTPIARRVLIQKDEQIESLMPVPGFSLTKTKAVADSGWLTRISLNPSCIKQIISGENPYHSDVDPFAEPDPSVRDFVPVTGSVKPPKVLKSLLDHEVLDAGKWFEGWGLVVKEDEFLGYDPLREMLYFHSPRESSIKMLEDLLFVLDGHGPSHVIVSLDGMGQSRLIARSGQKANITRMAGEKKLGRSLDIEPVVGENDTLVDLRFVFEDQSSPTKSSKVNSAVTLQVGECLEVAAGWFGEAERTPLRVKAEVYRPIP